jgi:hypothetical protein
MFNRYLISAAKFANNANPGSVARRAGRDQIFRFALLLIRLYCEGLRDI